MKRHRITFHELAKVEKALSSLSYPLYVERERRGPVKVVDSEGNFIQITSYGQLPNLLMFIMKNCEAREETLKDMAKEEGPKDTDAGQKENAQQEENVQEEVV